MRKNVKGSKLLAMLLALTLMLGMMPSVFASAEGSIAVTSLTDGEVIENGTNVSLQAEWDFADVERVDFYANGEKLPGFVTESGERMVWQSPAAGAYAVKAVTTFVSGETEESEAVTVYVKPADAVAVLYADADLDGWYSNSNPINFWGDMKPVGDSAWGGYSASYTAAAKWFLQYFKSYTLPTDKKYLNLQLYIAGIPEDKENVNHLDSKLEYYQANGKGASISAQHNLKNGWNTLSIDISNAAGLEMNKLNFYKSDNATLTADEWKALTVQANGIYCSDSIYDAAGLAAVPAVPNGKTNVCNELKKYRINFNRPLANNMTEEDLAGSVTIATTNGEVEGLSVVPGADFIDVVIPESSLALNTEYTVAVAADKVIDFYGNSYAGGSFTFTTIANECTNAEPIPSVTYPKNESTVSADSKLSASVIFSGNVSAVEFVSITDAETALTGTVVKSGREYTLIPDDGQLVAGNSYTVKAKATTEGGVFYSDAVTFSVGASTAYSLVGIENGDNVMINDNLGKTVYVIDDSAKSRYYDGKENNFKVKNGKSDGSNGAENAEATYVNPEKYAEGIAKVVYYLNGERTAAVTEAPYDTEIDTKKIGANTLVAEIHDMMGGVTTIERSFNAAYGYVASSYNEDFESDYPVVPETMISKYPDVTFADATATTTNDERKQVIDTHNGSKALGVYSGRGYTYANCAGTKNTNHSNIGLWPEALDVTAGTSRVFLEFDYSADKFSHNIHYIALEDAFKLSKGDNAKYGVIVLPKDLLQGTAKNNFKTTRIGLDIEWDTDDHISWKVYLNGKECYRQSTYIMYDTTIAPVKLTPVLAGNQISVWNYIDNIRVAAYTIPDEDVVGVAAEPRSFTADASAQITVANKSANPTDILNFVAVYDNESGKLVGATPYEIDLQAETVNEGNYTITVEDGQTAKIFTWFKDGLKPVTLK